MLVLSRHPQEKILFPGTGISIEIVQTKGNTVRVGIEAPRSIRVLRAEIAEPGDLLAELPCEFQSHQASSLSHSQQEQFVRQLDEIYLAVALAQNQNRQDLSDNVCFALDEAIERLEDLKNWLTTSSGSEKASAICESKSAYAVQEQDKDHATTFFINPAPGVGFRFEFGLKSGFESEFSAF